MKSFTCKELLPNFIDITDKRIERESQIKLLGITIDDKLKFDKYIDILYAKLQQDKLMYCIDLVVYFI